MRRGCTDATVSNDVQDGQVLCPLAWMLWSPVQTSERERVGSDHRISSLVPAPSTPTARLANTRGGEGGHGSDLAT
jgi:hypothetical protein